MTGRPNGRARAMAKRLLVTAIVYGMLAGGGLVPLRASAAEHQGQRSLAERLCGLHGLHSREIAELVRVVRDRFARQVADEFARHAASGNAVAQCALGMLYAQGWGVPQDLQQAAAWYRKAAEQGYAWAQYNLGVLYDGGRGVPQDLQQAAAWFRKAAEQGDAAAQFNLGQLYELGRGVPQDHGQAAAWYRKAAEQGHAMAQFNLGQLYEHGLGVPQDFVLAYMWASLAASQESQLANLRDRIALKMTSQQMAEGQRLARAWKPGANAPAERLETAPERPAASHGTGFVVSRQGHVLTANHVVAGCRMIQASLEGRTLPLSMVASDPTNDAAVLKLSQPLPHTARFRAGRSIQPGEGVVVIGFPLAGLLAAQPQVTTCVVSALAGIGNDTRLLQITAPVQPGNSGGPLLDQRGAVVGMVVSKLDARQLEKLTGDLPQNVNFALTGAVLKAVLDSVPVAYEESASSRPMETADVADQARRFTLALECR